MKIPKLYHYGKINVPGEVMSKRKIKELIESGKYSGYDDPRLYTIRGLLNRGMTYQGLDIIMEKIGYSPSHVDVDCTMIWGINKKIIDKLAGRYCVIPENYIEVLIDLPHNFPSSKSFPKFIRNDSLGTKMIYYTNTILLDSIDINNLEDNEEVTLMNFGNL